jgi:hypothetical protein
MLVISHSTVLCPSLDPLAHLATTTLDSIPFSLSHRTNVHHNASSSSAARDTTAEWQLRCALLESSLKESRDTVELRVAEQKAVAAHAAAVAEVCVVIV